MDKKEDANDLIIKMIKDGQVIEFDAKVSTFALEKFVDDMV